MRQLRDGHSALEVARTAAGRFFADQPILLGAEATARRELEELPCGQRTDTGRARLVRRQKNPSPLCPDCSLREECFQLSPQPALLWQWQKLGLLDRELRLTLRGKIVSFFLGPEGLALAAALEDGRYPLEDLVFDTANLFAGDRFAGTNPRRLGRLVRVCEHTYRRITIEGWLEHGVPTQYGSGAAEAVRALVEQKARRGEVAAAHEYAGRGDIDRLLTEWRSLLRQVAGAPALKMVDCGMRNAESEGPESEAAGFKPGTRNATTLSAVLARRWDEFRGLCRAQLGAAKADALPNLPPLTAEQRRPVNHRFFRATAAKRW
ncbi:MAG: hypothetical protein A3G75_08000 [Verrucomicrobia bacterium RIFCSPLOWO2_12_FULL_64_8]|nr:MAG: hypothetical protein A3G75_08000 [Verrucomicrobia bacterium RIFCSPLOWO2_12_FULL_64_8]